MTKGMTNQLRPVDRHTRAPKRGRVIRAAKECLNGIDSVDVNRSYRDAGGHGLVGHVDHARPSRSVEMGQFSHEAAHGWRPRYHHAASVIRQRGIAGSRCG